MLTLCFEVQGILTVFRSSAVFAFPANCKVKKNISNSYPGTFLFVPLSGNENYFPQVFSKFLVVYQTAKHI